jgi:adenylylsulfate kinase
MKNKAPVIWFTGLSGAGKSTLCQSVYKNLSDCQIQTAIIDGDVLRQGLCRDLGFTEAARSENIRRAGEVAKLFSDAGILTLAAFMSPMSSDRNSVRELIGANRFIEIYCKCSFETCESRDTKGLYKKARSGELKNFIGLDATYEEPESPELIIETDQRSVEESTKLILELLKNKGFAD